MEIHIEHHISIIIRVTANEPGNAPEPRMANMPNQAMTLRDFMALPFRSIDYESFVETPQQQEEQVTGIIVDLAHVTHWRDFTYRNINHSFGFLLDGCQVKRAPDGQVSEPHEPKDIHQLQSTATDIFAHLAEAPLDSGYRGLVGRLGLKPGIVRQGGGGGLVTNTPGSLPPGVSFCLPNLGEDKIAVGITRPISKCNFAGAAADETQLVALRQLVAYCKENKTRYAFVITEDSVIFVRVFAVDAGHTKYGAHYKEVFWQEEGPGELTVPLALWAMVLASARTSDNPADRDITTEEKMLPVDEWRTMFGSRG